MVPFVWHLKFWTFSLEAMAKKIYINYVIIQVADHFKVGMLCYSSTRVLRTTSYIRTIGYCNWGIGFMWSWLIECTTSFMIILYIYLVPLLSFISNPYLMFWSWNFRLCCESSLSFWVMRCMDFSYILILWGILQISSSASWHVKFSSGQWVTVKYVEHNTYRAYRENPFAHGFN